MKKLMIFLLMSSLLFIYAAEDIELESAINGIVLDSMSETDLEVSCGLSEITKLEISTDQGGFYELTADGFSYKNEIGLPKLIEQGKLIAVPLGADVEIEIISESIAEYNLTDWNIYESIIPVQPPLAKSADPAGVEFVYDESAYTADKWYGAETIRTEEIGILRGMRIFRLVYSPLSYNPVEGVVRVHNDVDAVVNFVGSDFAATQDLRNRTWSPAFEKLYANSIMNYSRLDVREDITRYPIKYVIISDPMFEDQLQPFIEWKTQKGFEVICAYTDEIGNSTTAIAGYIESLWEEASADDPAPSYILFVGDTAQVPAYNGSQGSHVTDLNYVRLEGGDFMPEIYYGRFSAQNTSQLQPQIDKTMEYEMFTMPDPSYLGEVVMIAGMDASHGSQWGNGQINYGTSTYFNAAHGITSHTYLYPVSGSSSNTIIQNVSQGVGYVNYTAHGSSTSWADPSFTISNINNLNNIHEYPMVVGNCCLTNKFEVSECFGEAWLREEDGGSIGYIGGTNSTYWDEDFWWGVGSGNITSNPSYNSTGPGAYDGMFHDHGENFSDWYTTSGSVIMAGNLAVVQGGGSYNYYWEIYSLMGDPSLQPYFGVPQSNEVAHSSTIFIGASSFSVNAEPYSYIGLSMGGELIASGITDASGSVLLEFPAISSAGEIDLVVTCQNCEPYYGTIQAVPNEGAFISITDHEILSDNGDGVIDFGEMVQLNLELENAGIDPAANVSAVMTIDDPYIYITNATASMGTIGAGETAVLEGFAFEVMQTVPDDHSFQANFVFSYNDDENEGMLSLTAHAPVFELGNTYISNDNNNNGRLDPGETADVQLEIMNLGSSTAENIICLVSSNNENITISNTWSFIPEIVPGDSGLYPFMVEVSADCPIGEIINFTAEITAGTELSYTDNFSLNVGLNLEDFESGTLSSWEWETSGDADWFVSQESVYEGIYCAESGDIGNGEVSTLSIEIDVLYDDEISFYRKVSSESGWDKLFFFIDDEEMEDWSGNLGWEQFTFPVSAGNHTLSWIYDKDGSVSSGSDCAWLDYIVFPAIGIPQPPEMHCSVTSLYMDAPMNTVLFDEFVITNTGGGTLYYDLSIEETTRSIEGSSFTCDAETYVPGQQVTWTFEVYNGSTDAEWLTDIIVEFPAGVNVISATDFTGASDDLIYNGATGSGASVEWNDPNGGWGQIHGNESAQAEVTVLIDTNQNGGLDLDWTLIGDDYGSTPHQLDGTITLTTEVTPLEWVQLEQYSGVLNSGESSNHTVIFDSNDMMPGVYTANLTINDSRNITVIPITFAIGGDIVYGDIDDNGTVEALDASLILQYAVGIDPAPFAPLPWEPWVQVRADVDGNNAIEAYDASLVLQYNVGLITAFPVEQSRSEEVATSLLDYRLIDDEIVFSSDSEVFSIMLSSKQTELAYLESYNEDALSAVNTENNFRIAIASAEAMQGDMFKLRYSGNIEEDLYFRYTVNGVEHELNIPQEELEDAQLPEVTSLKGNYPNPFNPSTMIAYELAEDADVELSVYNIKGQKVTTLIDKDQSAGKYQLEWNAEGCTSGVYFYRLNAGRTSYTRRMILLK